VQLIRSLHSICLKSQHCLSQAVSALRNPLHERRLGRIARPVLIAATFSLALSSSAGAASSGQPSGAEDRIVITGAAGHLGELTVRDLLARGVPASRLILVTRTPEKLAEFANMGASVRYGDFTNPSSLPAAFAGGNRMLLISIDFGKMPRPEAHKNAIDAAIADGVKHIAYTSWIALSGGDRSGLGADHYATEQILEGSGIAWTFLRNSEYMEELLPVAEAMAATGHAMVPPDVPRVGLVARADCAAAAAAVLSTPGHDRKVYNITGAMLVGPHDLGAAVSDLTGKDISINVIAPPSSAPMNPASNVNALRALRVVGNGVETLTGRPPTTLRAFLQQHRAEILHTSH
jgi:NAD(P)H dehydrogenase (quinone)